MTTTAVTTTMIDPLISAQRTERPQAARALPARSKQGPAHNAKIITAGLSTSLVLGIVCYHGNAAAQASNTTVPTPTVPSAVPTAVPADPTSGSTGVTTYTPVVVGTAPAVQSGLPAVQSALPATPQVISVAVPVPVPPPVAAPQPAAPPAVTSGTTAPSA